MVFGAWNPSHCSSSGQVNHTPTKFSFCFAAGEDMQYQGFRILHGGQRNTVRCRAKCGRGVRSEACLECNKKPSGAEKAQREI